MSEILPSKDEVAPRPWRLWKVGERSEIPHIADANGRVVARAEGNIWTWQDFIAPVILAAVNGATDETCACPPNCQGLDNTDKLCRAETNLTQCLTQAALDILVERHRQVTEEGWTPEHDDEHINGELAAAAACYAQRHRYKFWPWDLKWWKPKGARLDLVRAGALLLAEIERLDRAHAQKADEGQL